MGEGRETSEKLFAYWLCNLSGMYSFKIRSLLGYFGSYSAVFRAKRCQLEQIENIGKSDIDRILADKNVKKIQNDYEKAKSSGIHFTYQGEDTFPEKLRNIPDAPYGLFYKGKLPEEGKPSVAMVGARRATAAGRRIAEKLGYELAANGVQVISGMALGIDIFSQKGAMQWQTGHTYAVLGTGVDVCYPVSHFEMYMEIQERGGVLSEFPLGTQALPHHFPVRNRIISGLSDGVLVIEARKKSGSLITAECGLEQGKEIFVVPGGIFDPQYEGGNQLLKSGAVLVTEVKDILDGLGIYLDMDLVERKKKTNIMLETVEKMVYASLSLEPIHISALSEELKLETSRLMEVLLSLQRKGAVEMVGNSYFIVKI